MAKIKLMYIGGAQPQQIVEVKEDKVKGLMARGDYVMVEEASGKIKSFTGKKKEKEEKKDGETREG